jgi:hypothetical protein
MGRGDGMTYSRRGNIRLLAFVLLSATLAGMWPFGMFGAATTRSLWARTSFAVDERHASGHVVSRVGERPSHAFARSMAAMQTMHLTLPRPARMIGPEVTAMNCDCAESLAGALGGSTCDQAQLGMTPAAPIVSCPWCGKRSVEPELADVAAFFARASRL